MPLAMEFILPFTSSKNFGKRDLILSQSPAFAAVSSSSAVSAKEVAPAARKMYQVPLKANHDK